MASGSGLRVPLALRVPMRSSQRLGVRLPPPRKLSLAYKPVAPEPTLPPPAPAWVMPVRLRSFVLVLAVGLCGRWFAPRALAYWQLHNTATEVSDYAVCMVGGAGPELLWQRPAEFWRLVRRRLLASPEEARPFAACLPSAGAFSDAAERRRAYQASARDFREYAGAATAQAAFSLDDLKVSGQRLDELAQAARPLLTKDPIELLHASLRARSAPALFELPVPALGRGLPAADLGYATVKQVDSAYVLAAGRGANLSGYWTRDGGRTWLSASPEELSADLRSGTCSVARAHTSFRLGMVGDLLQVETWQNGQLSSSAPLAPAERNLIAFACDAEGVVAVLGDETRRQPATFRWCPAAGRCRELAVPAAVAHETAGPLALSAARARGATILALSRQGIVRVFSSRDAGQTWTPPVVAYDAAELPETTQFRVPPSRLLSLGDRVLLYAGADAEHSSYPVLASDDLGASWHAP
jgi:hypothetical protein